MNDESFDKILNDKLNVEKDFLFTEGDWQTMERQIDVAQAARRRRWLWLGASLLLLPLFGLLGWNSWALYKAQSTIDGLAQEVKTLRQEKETTVTTPSVFKPNEGQQTTTKSDTVYHHIIVKRYDTIFQTVVRRDLSDAAPSVRQDVSTSFQKGKTETTVSQTVTENSVKPKTTVSKQPKQEEKVLEKPAVSTEKTDIIAKNEEAKPIDKPISIEKETLKDSEKNAVTQPVADYNKAILENKKDTTIAKQPLRDTFGIFSQKKIETQKAPKSPQLTEKTLEKPAENEKTRRLPIIKPIKIAGYDIGVSSGLAIIDGQDILRQDGFSIGGRGSILLGERWKVLGEVEYVALSYEVSKITGLDIPTIAPPTANDELKEVRVEQPYWHYSLGLQYALTKTRLKPYIGVSALGQSKLEEKFEYQFENKLTKEDVFVKTMRNDNSFQMPFLRLQAGAEYPIFGKIKAQVETSYDVNIGNVQQFKPLWQVKGAVLYRF
ncbi:MAG: hypothetical protein JNL70_28150 [Saprospiraceae bacterium]|nr:hypothetical protein [Saprospiraceae bacterium]